MAYQIIAKRHPTINLLCLGPQANPFELQSITQAGLRDKVYFQQPPDKHLDAYYKNAMCYVSSSLDEGFGLPILEAFRNYTPTILSDIPIYREIADDCALYFNPLSPQSISACIEDILFDKQKCKKIIAIGAERSKTFCIENCATNTLNAYRNTM
jgi:glycosyltransferase involved in cell wall biosynthesis